MFTYDLVISGHQISVRSPADEATVQRVARLVDERYAAASAQGAPPVACALLAALDLADELMKSRAEADRLRELRDRAEAGADALLSMLDDVQPPRRGKNSDS